MGNDAQGFQGNLCLFSFVCWFRKMPQITETRKRLTLKEKFQINEDSSAPGFKQSACALKWGVSPDCMNKLLKQNTTM